MAQAGIVALLFTDVVGSTELLDRLGDDAAEDLRRTHFGLLREVVVARGGQEVKNLGDGLMVVFESTLDAVDAAVAVQQAVEWQNRTSGQPLQIRVGVHVGEPIREEGDYFGMPVVIARRLCDAAEAGQVLTSQLVQRLVDRHRPGAFRELGLRTLRGLSEPVAVMEVMWSPRGVTAFDVPLALDVAADDFFVGREAEMAQLAARLADAATGRKATVFLAGEPGIGKTRLTAELARAAAVTRGALVLYGRCDEGLGVAYQPFVESLGHHLTACPDADLAAHDPSALAELARLLPPLAQRLDLPVPARAGPESDRYRLFEAVVDVLEVLARAAPVVLVLEDLHWATKPTSLLLRHVARAGRSVRLLTIGTYRDTELTPGHPMVDVLAELRREESVDRVHLTGLDPATVVGFVAASAGHDLDERAVQLAHALYHQTGGNPFFLGEILTSLAESGVLYLSGGRWTSDRTTIAELGLPEGVREVLGRRLGRLSPEANRALTVGAVVGARFSAALLERIPEAGTDVESTLDALDEAVAAGLLVDRGSEYAFAHALIRQTIYAELSSPRRARLHLSIGEALEAMADSEREVDALARHFCAAVPAAPPQRAVAYALQASQQALDHLAFEEAASVAERALDVLAFEPSADQRERAALLLAVAEACNFSGDLAGMKEAAAHAADAARAARSPELLAQAAVQFGRWVIVGTPDASVAALCREALATTHDAAPALRAWLLFTLANYLLAGEGRAGEAGELADEALRLARQGEDPDVLAQALSLRAQSLLGTPDLARRAALAEENVDLGERLGDSQVRLLGLVMRATTRLEVGDLRGFEEHVAVLRNMGEELHWWAARFWTQVFGVTRALIDGRLDEAETMADALLATGTGDANALNTYAAQLLLVRREQGRLAELRPLIAEAAAENPGLPAFRSALALADATAGDLDAARDHLAALAADGFALLPRDQFFVVCLALLAETAVMVGDVAQAAALADLLRPHGGRLITVSTGVGCFGAVDRFLGMLAALVGDGAEATARFDAALALEEGIGSRSLAERTRLWMARLT